MFLVIFFSAASFQLVLDKGQIKTRKAYFEWVIDQAYKNRLSWKNTSGLVIMIGYLDIFNNPQYIKYTDYNRTLPDTKKPIWHTP